MPFPDQSLTFDGSFWGLMFICQLQLFNKDFNFLNKSLKFFGEKELLSNLSKFV